MEGQTIVYEVDDLMTDAEKLAQQLDRIANVVNGLGKTAHIVGIGRDQFSWIMTKSAEALRERTLPSVPFQSECPGCKRKITVAFVNGQRKVKWSE